MTNRRLDLDEILPEGAKLLSFGVVDEKVEIDIKMTAHLYKYIEEQVHFYDDERDPSRCNWMDIEGFGYGWLWLRRPEDEWHKMMRERIYKVFKYCLYRNHTDVKYIIYKHEGVKVYHFVTYEHWREDYIFRFSNSELYY